PRCTGPALRLVGTRRAPHRDERLLQRVLGTAAVAKAAQREAEDRTGIPLVELLERGPVARAGPLDQLPVRAHGEHPRSGRLQRIRHPRSYGADRVVGFRLIEGYLASPKRRATSSQLTTFHQAAR